MVGARTERQRARRSERKMEELALSNRMGISTHGKSGREKILIEMGKRIRWCLKAQGKDGFFERNIYHQRMGEIQGLAIAWAILVRPYDDTMVWADKLTRREFKKWQQKMQEKSL